jgi:hypothetical protein
VQRRRSNYNKALLEEVKGFGLRFRFGSLEFGMEKLNKLKL